MDSLYSKARGYAGVLPYNKDLLPRHSSWEKWFDNKRTIIDEPAMNIDEWMNTPCHDDIYSSDEEAVVVDYDSGKETVESAARNQTFLPNQKCQNTNLQVGLNDCNTLAGKLNFSKHYFDDIENVSIWPQKGIDELSQPPISKQDFHTTKGMDNWFCKLDKLKGKMRIAETRTISYSRNCDSDSVDTAEYIRGARGKGNKSSSGKTRNRLIKEYSKVATIKLKKTIMVNRIKRRINSSFPLDESESCSEEEVVNQNKTNRNNHFFPHDDSETPPRIYNKMRRNRLQSQTNTVKTRLHSYSDSLCEGKHRHHFDYRNSCSSDSDPDDRILDNVRKIHKNINQDIIEPAIIEPIIEFPETDQQLVTYDHNECATVPFSEISSNSDEDVKNEEDILCMSNSERLLLYGKGHMECGNLQESILYDFTKTDDSSTDDDLFRPQSYITKAK